MTGNQIEVADPPVPGALGGYANQALDLAALVALILLGAAPLASVFDDPRYWLAVLGATLVGVGVVLVAIRLRADLLIAAGLTIAGYFLFGGLFAVRADTIIGVLPSLRTLRDLVLNTVYGWKQLLTVSVPVSGFDHLYGVPYLAVLIVTVAALSIALRTRTVGIALIPVTALLVFSIAFGADRGFFPAVVGVAYAGLALGWTSWRRGRLRGGDLLPGDSIELRRRASRTLAIGAAILVACVGVGGAVTAAAVQSMDRQTLREQVVPPMEIRDYASPLMSFRKFIEDGDDKVLFRVSGLPAATPIRLATLDLYDGIVYQVSGAGGSASGVFNKVGRSLPGGAAGTTVQVKIEGLGGVWLPGVGYPSQVEVAGPRAVSLRSGLLYDAATGTALQTSGAAAGDIYTFTTSAPATPTAEQLDAAKLAKLTTSPPTMTPDAIQSRLDEAVTGVESPAAQVRAIEKYLQEKGYFSHGQPNEVPSRPGHTFERLSTMLDSKQMIGDDEQYAVAMALMLAQAGLPSRVVMGFATDDAKGPGQAPNGSPGAGEIAVTGKDVRAWVEVPFDGLGWVAFHPTPTRKPDKQTPETLLKPRIQVPQPPLPPQEPAELPPQPPDPELGADDRGPNLAWVWLGLRIAGISLGVLAVVLGPGLLMLMAKQRRRQRRRSAPFTPDRMSGGWSEIVETAGDVGVRVGPNQTRREQAAQLDGGYPSLQLRALAAQADAGVFGAVDPSPEETEGYWSAIDHTRHQVTQQTTWKQRLRYFFVPGSVLGSVGLWLRARWVRIRTWRKH